MPDLRAWIEASISPADPAKLPPPEHMHIILRRESVLLVEAWCRKYGAYFTELRLASRYLAHMRASLDIRESDIDDNSSFRVDENNDGSRSRGAGRALALRRPTMMADTSLASSGLTNASVEAPVTSHVTVRPSRHQVLQHKYLRCPTGGRLDDA